MMRKSQALNLKSRPLRGVIAEAAQISGKPYRTVQSLYRRGDPAICELVLDLAEKRLKRGEAVTAHMAEVKERLRKFTNLRG